MSAPLVTVGIPLYRSARFVDNIIACIAAMPGSGVEILVSDRHLADDALSRIAAATADDARVRCIGERDELDWVQHINLLMQLARGRYWRLMPHDDYVPPGGLEALLQVMQEIPALLVAYASTRAEYLSGRALPERHVLSAMPEAGATRVYGHALDLPWAGYFDGAFKGLVRLGPIRARQLWIRPNVGLVGSERLWLFALALLGPFRFVPHSVYIKRFHDSNTHRTWRHGPRQRIGALRVMRSYLRDLHPPGEQRRLAESYLRHRTFSRAFVFLRHRRGEVLPWPLMAPLIARMPWLGRRVTDTRRRLLALPEQPMPEAIPLRDNVGVVR